MEGDDQGTNQEERGDGVEEDGEVAGDPVWETQSAHGPQVLQQVVGAVAKAGQDGQQAEEEAGPGGDVDVEEVEDMDATISCKDEVNKEQENKKAEDGDGAEREAGGLVAGKAAGNDLEEADDAGEAGDDEQDEEERGPEPGEVKLGEGGVHEGTKAKPDSLEEGEVEQEQDWRPGP